MMNHQKGRPRFGPTFEKRDMPPGLSYNNQEKCRTILSSSGVASLFPGYKEHPHKGVNLMIVILCLEGVTNDPAVPCAAEFWTCIGRFVVPTRSALTEVYRVTGWRSDVSKGCWPKTGMLHHEHSRVNYLYHNSTSLQRFFMLKSSQHRLGHVTHSQPTAVFDQRLKPHRAQKGCFWELLSPPIFNLKFFKKSIWWQTIWKSKRLKDQSNGLILEKCT